MVRRRRAKTRPSAYVISEKTPKAHSTGVRIAPAGAQGAAAGRSRILMCIVAFMFVFASLGARLAAIAIGGAGYGSDDRRLAAADGPRPEIVDRNGALLAADLPTTALEIAGRDVWDAQDTARRVASILPRIDADALEARLAAGEYVEVVNDIAPAERAAIFHLGLPGVRFAPRVKRFYPQADLAAHLVGHGEPGRGGVMGLEAVANGAGAAPLHASLDIRVQQVLEDELAAAMAEFSAEAAWGAIMDVETGEVVALASLPDFDPNEPGAAPADFRRNRAVYDRYELGSAFKAITAAAALDARVAAEATEYDARGSFKVADRRITDFHGENRILTFSEVVQHSSNIGAARMAGDLGPARQRDYLKALGFFDPLPISLPERRAPEPPSKWGPVECATVAYGHGIAVTPLHLLAGFAAVANGGVYRSPTFVAGEAPAAERRVFADRTSAVMRRVLRRVITDGTAEFAEAGGYFPIGKTATADKPSVGGYSRRARISSFVGAFPGHDPRYAVLVSLDEPQPTKDTYGYATAGWNAAPAFSRIVTRAAPLLGVARVDEATALAAFMSDRRLALAETGDGALAGGSP